MMESDGRVFQRRSDSRASTCARGRSVVRAAALLSAILASACGTPPHVVDSSGRALEDCLVLAYRGGYESLVFPRSERRGAALTSQKGRATGLPYSADLAILKPGYHPVFGSRREYMDHFSGVGRSSKFGGPFVLHEIKNPGNFTWEVTRARWEGGGGFLWRGIEQPLGDLFILEGHADRGGFGSIDFSDATFRITCRKGFLCPTDRLYWDEGPDLTRKTKTLNWKGRLLFFILDDNLTPIAKVLAWNRGVDSLDKSLVNIDFTVFKSEDPAGSLEPSIVLHHTQADSDEIYNISPSREALRRFHTRKHYEGPLPAEEAERIVEDYLSSYEPYVGKEVLDRIRGERGSRY